MFKMDTDKSNNLNTLDKETEKDVEKDVEKEGNKDSDTNTTYTIGKYILIGICVLLICFVLYYAYKTFLSNSDTDEIVNKKNKTSETASSNYDLRNAIKKLKNMQDRILRNISSDVGI